MRTCEAIYGPEQAANIEHLIVMATGTQCPCRSGLRCPLLDEAGCNPLACVVPQRSAPSLERR